MINKNRFNSPVIKEKKTIDNDPNFPTSLNTSCAQIHVYATVCALGSDRGNARDAFKHCLNQSEQRNLYPFCPDSSIKFYKHF